jgi:hypothetical protein
MEKILPGFIYRPYFLSLGNFGFILHVHRSPKEEKTCNWRPESEEKTVL